MERMITITAGNVTAGATLSDSPTADAIWNALPFEARADLWGEEIYFSIPVSVGLEEGARETVAKGDLGYWPSGPAFCIFFGKTPVSRGDEIRPASAVNVFGKVTGDPNAFKKVPQGTKIRVERAR